MQNLQGLLYLVAAVFFIMALRGLSSPSTSRQGNFFGIIGMGVAVGTTILFGGLSVSWILLIVVGIAIGGAIGLLIAKKIDMTQLPQLVAGFHSLVGLSAVCVAVATFYNPAAFHIGEFGNIKAVSLIEMSLGVAIGAVTFSGSVIAFAKLQGLMSGNPITFKNQHLLNAVIGGSIVLLIVVLVLTNNTGVFWLVTLLSFAIGFLLIIPIGGADMPVVVSMLNSYSGWAAAGIGFTLHNPALVIVGALVGASGAILSYIMCKGMNRSIFNVLLGGFGTEVAAGGGAAATQSDRPVKAGAADDAAYFMANAEKVIIVPGYGMAVAQAQHALREMADKLKEKGVDVRYAIHPVAGRMPGHMNVLLAEANVPYDEVFELEEINHEFSTADVVYVIGANDVTNPAAKTDPTSNIYGMPILDVEKSQMVFFNKRSMGAGYAGIENELFFRDNTTMLFGDAKAMTEEIVQAIDKA